MEEQNKRKNGRFAKKVTIKDLEAMLDELSIAAVSILTGVEKPEVRDTLKKIEAKYKSLYKSIDEKAGKELKAAIEYEERISLNSRKKSFPTLKNKSFSEQGTGTLPKTGERRTIRSISSKYSLVHRQSQGIVHSKIGYNKKQKRFQEIQEVLGEDDLEFATEFENIKKILDETHDFPKESVPKPVERSQKPKRLKKLDNVEFNNSTIEDVAALRGELVAFRSMKGKLTAKAVAKGYTILSLYHTLKGDENKQQELLSKARETTRKKMAILRNRNQKSNNTTIKIIKNAEKIRQMTYSQDIRNTKVKELRTRNAQVDESIKWNPRKDKNVRKAQRVIDNADKFVDGVENFLYDTAMDATVLEMDRTAKFIAGMSPKISTGILGIAENITERLYRKEFGFANKRVASKKQADGFFSRILSKKETQNVEGFYADIDVGRSNVTRRNNEGRLKNGLLRAVLPKRGKFESQPGKNEREEFR